MNVTILLFLFLSQFTGLISIGSSYMSPAFAIVPLMILLKRKTCKVFILVSMVITLSAVMGWLDYGGKINILELGSRLLLYSYIPIAIVIYKWLEESKIKSQRELVKVLSSIQIVFIPSLIVCLLETFKRFGVPIENIIVAIKTIMIPGRGTYTTATISGFFPEHGLFPPFIYMISGISFLILYIRMRNGLKLAKVIKMSCYGWIAMGFLHLSGLGYISIAMALSIILIILTIKVLTRLKLKKAIFVSIIVAALCIVLIWNIGIYFEWELIDRLTSILSLIGNANFIVELSGDPSLQFKILPFILLMNSLSVSVLGLAIGSGSTFYSAKVIDELKSLPTDLVSNVYFISNQENSRFALNSLYACQIIEVGLIGLIMIYILIDPGLKFSFVKRMYKLYVHKIFARENSLVLMAVIFLTSSVCSGMGAVPTTYPFTFISLSLLGIIAII